ncbi:MAG TPA: hypothetical protein VKR58_09995 [Aquella sp.]|nr:hypothetical protein [Aquella sp.]
MSNQPSCYCHLCNSYYCGHTHEILQNGMSQYHNYLNQMSLAQQMQSLQIKESPLHPLSDEKKSNKLLLLLR